jgi:beta-glucosidase
MQPSSTLLFLALIGVSGVLAAACGDRSVPQSNVEVYRDPNAPLEKRVEDLLGRMTLEEKVEQMHGSGFPADSRGLYPTPANDRLGIPGFTMVDGPRGVSAATGFATTFPVGSARGATFDPDLERQVGRAMGEEARARQANVLLAPTINLLRQPQWGRAQETYGEDTTHVGIMGAAFIQGVQENVVASAKHFALNTIEDTRFKVNVTADERTLREIYLPHFKRAVDAGVGSVMSAYNKVNGEYCSENHHLLTDVLRDDWKFDGLVESDWLLAVYSTAPSANAGLDIEMPLAKFYGAPLVDAVNAGDVPQAVIDDAVRNILRVKFRFGIFDGRPPLDPATVVESPEHHALALEVARKAIVLLKNDGGALPLDRSAVRSVAVVGALADVANLGDTGSSSARPSSATSPLQGIQAAAGAAAIKPVLSDELSADQAKQVAQADAAVVVVGLTSADEGEGLISGGDRKTLEISAAHQQLVRDVASQNPRTIVVLEGGSAITVEGWIDRARALLMAWYPGQDGGTAIAEVLFGDVNPSGKLDVTVPTSAAQLPPFDPTATEVTYEYFHGYRLVDRQGETPRYPFGFGGSYTTFSVHDLTLDSDSIAPDGTLRANVQVTNTGARSGDEVVQLYVGAVGSQVERAVRDLRAFQRVSLDAGETKSVTLEVPAADLAYFDVTAGRFVVEPIEYSVQVGTSSRDLPLQASVRVTSP